MLIALLALTAVMASDDPDGVVTTAPPGISRSRPTPPRL
jgi:hypothetical protein